MNRTELEDYILTHYAADMDHPWVKYPRHTVFRHGSNRKWFALLLDVSKKKLGLPDDGVLDIVNFKCDPVLIGSLQSAPGCFPAYHMNKSHWITVALDGSADDDQIKALLDMSFRQTAPRPRHPFRSS